MRPLTIDRKEKVTLGGFPQTIHIWSTDIGHPVLLFLHGGPGVPNRADIAREDLDLTDDFTVVSWDQRGTGGSYAGCNPNTLTIEQLVSDCRDLLVYLCRTLDKEKIILCCLSWGTCLGTLVVDRYPELVSAYIGYGQLVNAEKNEDRSYEYVLRKAKEAGNKKDLAILKRIGPPAGGIYNGGFDGLMAQRRLLTKYGGQNHESKSYLTSVVLPILLSREFTLEDKLGTAKGYQLCLKRMWPQLAKIDLLAHIPVFDVPYYIFQGRQDQNTPASLLDDYYSAIAAPDKDLIWFDDTGHDVLAESPFAFKQCLREKLLPGI